MGIVNGAFGAFTGRIGNLVSYNLNGVNVIRQIGKTKKAPTINQLAIRQKMATVISFLRPALSFINMGFALEILGSTKNQHNAAVSYNTKHAVKGEYPNMTLDYSKALVSKGNLTPAINPLAELTGHELTVTWEVSPEMSWGIKNDRCMLLIHCPELKKSINILSGNSRSIGHEQLILPSNFLDKELHIYLAFAANDGKSISDSVYVTTKESTGGEIELNEGEIYENDALETSDELSHTSVSDFKHPKAEDQTQKNCSSLAKLPYHWRATSFSHRLDKLPLAYITFIY